MSKYYVVVELRDYSDRIVGYSSCSLGEDISNQSIADGVRVAGQLMVNHHTGIREEQKKQNS
jgi:hypothetical protein